MNSPQMTSERQVFCAKLQQNLPGLAQPPFPGAMGQTIYASISQQAWQQWLTQQTILINEYRLNMVDPKSKTFLQQEMRQFLGLDKV